MAEGQITGGHVEGSQSTAFNGSPLEIHPLRLEAYDGPPHLSSDVDKAYSSVKEGVPAKLLTGRSTDGGTVVYNNSGDILSWTSANGRQHRTYTYTDSNAQRNQVPVPGEPVGVLGPSSMSQFVLDRARGLFNVVPVTPAQFNAPHRIDHILSQVKDDHGTVWLRDKTSGRMKQFVETPAGKLRSTGKTATDGQLLPATIQRPEEDRLYSDSSAPAKSIGAYGINQGMLGDCYFESVLGSFAAQQGKKLASMIKDNHDGTYTVNFPCTLNSKMLISTLVPKGSSSLQLEAGISVRVEAPTDAEVQAFNRARWEIPSWAKLPQAIKDQKKGPSVGYWAAVIEKAHRYATGEMAGDAGDDSKRATMFLTGIVNGTTEMINFKQDNSRPPDAKYLAGKPDAAWVDDRQVYSQAELGERIQNALNQGKVVAAGTPRDGTAWVRPLGAEQADSQPLYLIPQHSYSVLGYIPAKNGDEPQIILRNPLGVVATFDQNVNLHPLGDRKVDGYFQVSLKDFTKLFDYMSIGG